MPNQISQKTIDQYIDGRDVPEEKKEKVIMAITRMVYKRNQDIVKAESEQDKDRKEQLMRGAEEYEQMIAKKIDEVLDGEQIDGEYDF